jgi:hypothetical protein
VQAVKGGIKSYPGRDGEPVADLNFAAAVEANFPLPGFESES